MFLRIVRFEKLVGINFTRVQRSRIKKKSISTENGCVTKKKKNKIKRLTFCTFYLIETQLKLIVRCKTISRDYGIVIDS